MATRRPSEGKLCTSDEMILEGELQLINCGKSGFNPLYKGLNISYSPYPSLYVSTDTDKEN